MSKKEKWLAGAALSSVGVALASQASAQVPTAAPPVREVIDRRGIDLFRGRLVARQSLLSIGGALGLSYDVIYRGTTGASSVYGALDSDATGTTYTVSFSGRSDKFTRSGTTFTAVEPGGQQLKYDPATPTIYTYIARDGTVVLFNTTFANQFTSGNMNGNVGRVSSLTLPTGQSLSFSYTSGDYCTSDGGGGSGGGGGGGRGFPYGNLVIPARRINQNRDATIIDRGAGRSVPVSSADATEGDTGSGSGVPTIGGSGGGDPQTVGCTSKKVSRLLSVSTAYGYRLTFAYDTSDPNDSRGVEAWWAIKTVTAQNLAGCAPASTCSWPVLDLSTGTGINVADNTYTMGTSGVTNVKRYGSTTDALTLTYDGSARVATTKDQVETNMGVNTTYGYADTGSGASAIRTVTVTNGLGKATSYVFDITTERLKSVTDATGASTSVSYVGSGNGVGNIDTVTLPTGGTIHYDYDSRGNVTKTTRHGATIGYASAPDIITSATYPVDCVSTPAAVCNQPTATFSEYAAGASNSLYQTDYTYNPDGTVATITQPAPATGAVRPQTRFTYQTLQAKVLSGGVLVDSGQPMTLPSTVSECRTTTTCTNGADETRQVTTYDVTRNLWPSATKTMAGDNSLSATTTMARDPLGNLISVDGPLASADDTTTFRYDPLNRLVGTVSADPDGTSNPLPRRAERRTYSGYALATVETGTVTDVTDSAWSAFTSRAKVDYTYFNGLVRAATQSFGGTTYGVAHVSLDAAGRTRCVAQRLNPSAWGTFSSACTLQATGPEGPDRIVRYSYDDAGRPTILTSALATTEQANESTATYDAAGLLASVKDARNNLTSYGYDGQGRLVKTSYPSKTTPNTSSTTDFEGLTYDAASQVVTRQLRTPTSPSSPFTTSYTYDRLGRLTFKDRPNLNDSNADISYIYDNQGRTVSADGHMPGIGAGPGPGAVTTTLTYDALGRLTKEDSGAWAGALQWGYDAANRRTLQTWLKDGVAVSYAYLTTGEMRSVTQVSGPTLGTYDYDDLGRRIKLTRGGGASTSWGYKDTSLNDTSRLMTLAHDFTGSADDVTTAYTYTLSGQIKTATRSNDAYAWTGHYNVNRPYSVNGLNQQTLAGTTTLGYDDRGNLSQSGSGAGAQTFNYNGDNLMTSQGTGSSLAYDVFDRLAYVSDAAETVRVQRVGGEVATELDGSGAITRRFVQGADADEPLLQFNGADTSTKRYLFADERGSVVALANASGTVLAKNAYDEYGIPNGSISGRFGYTGQAWFPGEGLYDYKARMYSPTLGRFMQTDPIGYGSGVNWYNYVGGDPVNATDPSGMQAHDHEPYKPIEPSPPSPENQAPQPGDIVVNGHGNTNPAAAVGAVRNPVFSGNESGGGAADAKPAPQRVCTNFQRSAEQAADAAEKVAGVAASVAATAGAVDLAAVQLTRRVPLIAPLTVRLVAPSVRVAQGALYVGTLASGATVLGRLASGNTLGAAISSLGNTIGNAVAGPLKIADRLAKDVGLGDIGGNAAADAIQSALSSRLGDSRCN